VSLWHHQSFREFGTVVGILKSSAGKQDAPALAGGFDRDTSVASVLLSWGRAFPITTDHESINQGSAAKKTFRNTIGAQGWGDVVSCSGGLE